MVSGGKAVPGAIRGNEAWDIGRQSTSHNLSSGFNKTKVRRGAIGAQRVYCYKKRDGQTTNVRIKEVRRTRFAPKKMGSCDRCYQS